MLREKLASLSDPSYVMRKKSYKSSDRGWRDTSTLPKKLLFVLMTYRKYLRLFRRASAHRDWIPSSTLWKVPGTLLRKGNGKELQPFSTVQIFSMPSGAGGKADEALDADQACGWTPRGTPDIPAAFHASCMPSRAVERHHKLRATSNPALTAMQPELQNQPKIYQGFTLLHQHSCRGSTKPARTTNPRCFSSKPTVF